MFLNDIELTEEERNDAIRSAKQEKFIRQKREEWFKKVNETPVHYEPNAMDFYNALVATRSQTGKKFIVHDSNKKVIIQLCLYFSNDKRFGTDPRTGIQVFENKELSLDKGILLMGNPGTGKSHLMDFFRKNPKQSYTGRTCVKIAEQYRTGWSYEGLDTIEHYSNTPKTEIGHPWKQTHLGFCFNDLGAEDEKKNYGNQANVMEIILFNRYESKIPFHMTHITTNLNAAQIESFYGSRISNRIKESFNVFLCDWESFR